MRNTKLYPGLILIIYVKFSYNLRYKILNIHINITITYVFLNLSYHFYYKIYYLEKKKTFFIINQHEIKKNVYLKISKYFFKYFKLVF